MQIVTENMKFTANSFIITKLFKRFFSCLYLCGNWIELNETVKQISDFRSISILSGQMTEMLQVGYGPLSGSYSQPATVIDPTS